MFIRKTLILAFTLLFVAVPVRSAAAAEAVTVTLPVKCVAEGISEVFTCKIEPVSGSQDFEILADTLSLQSDGSDMFRLRFTEAGTYSFRIRQAPGKDRNVKYDASVYRADFHVFAREDGTLNAQAVAYIEGTDQKTESVIFTNTSISSSLNASLSQEEGESAKGTSEGTADKVSERTADKVPEGTVDRASERTADGVEGKVRTGDSQEALLYFDLFIFALLMLIYIIVGKRRRSALWILLLFMFLTPAAKVYAAPAEGATISHSGTFGTVTWEIYSDGTLVLRPTEGDEGTLWSTSETYVDSTPWYKYRNDITYVKTQGTIHLSSIVNNMFCGCCADEMDLSAFETSGVHNFGSMFSGCEAGKITGISNWDTSNAEKMSYMFSGCDVERLDLSEWDTGKVKNMDGMFKKCGAESLDLSGWDTKSLTDMDGMFSGSKALSIDLSGWDTSKVVDMGYMFFEAAATEIKGLSEWDLSSVTDITQMFYCSHVSGLDLSKWNTSNVTKMTWLFYDCAATDIDVSGWDTSKVTNMNRVFYYCGATSLDLSDWNTSNVTNMGLMFSGCAAKSLDLSGWDTSNVSYMESMLYTPKLTEITLSENFSFKGNGDTQCALCTPDSSVTTGYWIREDGGVDAKTAEELRDGWDDNAAAWAGKWVWEVKDTSAVVIFDSQGGYTAQQQINLAAADTITMPDAVRPTYTFIEWNTAEDGMGAALQPGDPFTPEGGSMTTFYAIWEKAARYTVNHYQQKAERNGYDLVLTESFYTKKNSAVTPDTNTYAGFVSPPEQTVTAAEDNSAVVEYYYDRITFTVHFDGNGSDSGDTADQYFVGGVSQRLHDNKFKKESAAFNGWNTQADGSGVVYGDAQSVLNVAGDGETFVLYAQWLNTENAVHRSTNGKYTIKVRPGETVTIPDLPAGTKYTITEKNIPDGWGQSAAEGTEGIIESNGSSTAAVTNRYSISGGTVDLKAYKCMTNDEAEEGQFAFELRDESGEVIMTAANGIPDMAEEIPAEEDGAASPNPYYGMSVVNFDEVPISSVGTHTFTIREIKGDDSGIEYDEHVENVTVYAVDNGKGTLTCSAVYDSDGPIFVNSAIPVFENPEEKGTLAIKKDVSNLTSSQIFPFTVDLRDPSGTELKENYTCDIVEKGHENDYMTRSLITASAVSHTENINDKGERKSGYQHNWNNSNIRGTGRESASSEAHVVTLEGASELQVTISYGSEYSDWTCMWQGAHSDYTAYDNYESSVTGRLRDYRSNGNYSKTYTVPGDTVTFSYYSNERFNGNGYGYYAVITAEVYRTDYGKGYVSTQELASGMSVNLSERQTAIIKGIPAGASYKVTEGETAGYELINTEGAEGTIAANATAEASFTNVYDGRGQAQIRMQKIFKGGRLSGGDFTFRLLDESGKVLDESSNDAGGGIVFKPIEYTIDDIGKRYLYTVEEVSGEEPEVIYDTHEETVVVEVSDGGDGNLTADIHYQDEAVFTNRSTKGMLAVKKVVEGNMGNRTSGFTFTAQLMDSGSAPFTEPVAYTKDGESGTITPSSDGKVAFDLRGGDEIIFTLPFGTKYAITEAEANKDGYKTTIENAEGTVTEETPEVVFTNSRGVTVPTMAEEKTPVWILLLPAAGIALVVISFMRRKKQ